MKALTQAEISYWCNEHSLEIRPRDWPRYRGEGNFEFLVKLPKSSAQTVALARYCFPFNGDGSFAGALVWFREWGIWNDMDEATAMRMVCQMRIAGGERRPLEEAPGQMFSTAEFVDARAFWTVGVVFGWDTFLFPLQSDYFAFNSHDEVVSFVAKSSVARGSLIQDFKDWEIEEGVWYLR